MGGKAYLAGCGATRLPGGLDNPGGIKHLEIDKNLEICKCSWLIMCQHDFLQNRIIQYSNIKIEDGHA